MNLWIISTIKQSHSHQLLNYLKKQDNTPIQIKDLFKIPKTSANSMITINQKGKILNLAYLVMSP